MVVGISRANSCTVLVNKPGEPSGVILTFCAMATVAAKAVTSTPRQGWINVFMNSPLYDQWSLPTLRFYAFATRLGVFATSGNMRRMLSLVQAR